MQTLIFSRLFPTLCTRRCRWLNVDLGAQYNNFVKRYPTQADMVDTRNQMALEQYALDMAKEEDVTNKSFGVTATTTTTTTAAADTMHENESKDASKENKDIDFYTYGGFGEDRTHLWSEMYKPPISDNKAADALTTLTPDPSTLPVVNTSPSLSSPLPEKPEPEPEPSSTVTSISFPPLPTTPISTMTKAPAPAPTAICTRPEHKNEEDKEKNNLEAHSVYQLIHIGVDFNHLKVGMPVASLVDGVAAHSWHDPLLSNGWGGRFTIAWNKDTSMYLSTSITSTTSTTIQTTSTSTSTSSQEHDEQKSHTHYLLYGHLDPTRLIAVGTHVKKGDIIGYVGEPEQNGGWFPHLHVQYMTRQFVEPYLTTPLGWEDLDGYSKDGKIPDGVLNPLKLLS